MDILILCIIGLFAGLLGGLLGVGGSIVMIPALTETFGVQQHLYQAAAMIVNFFVVIPAFFQHVRARAIIGPMVRRMIPLAIVAVAFGVLASEWSVFQGRGQAYLIILFGLFLFYVAAMNVLRMMGGQSAGDPKTRFDPSANSWKAGLLVGVPTGFVAGLLGVGGGVVCVPLQNRWLGVPLRNAIANSATTIIGLSFIGAIGKNYALAVRHMDHNVGESVKLAAALIPTAIIGSLIGSRLTHRIHVRALRVIFILFLLAAGVRMAYRGISRVVDSSGPTTSAILAPPDINSTTDRP